MREGEQLLQALCLLVTEEERERGGEGGGGEGRERESEEWREARDDVRVATLTLITTKSGELIDDQTVPFNHC